MAQPTFFLVPSFRFKPGSGPIALGNILSQPLCPDRALSMVDSLDRYPRVESVTTRAERITRDNSQSTSAAVWSEFLLSLVSGRLSGEHTTSSSDEFYADSIETSYFVMDPDIDEVERRLQDPRVRRVVRAGEVVLGRRNPVYMVTGIMVARGLKVTRETAQTKSGGIELKVDTPTPAGDVGVGSALHASREARKGREMQVDGDIVFAYQLMKIKVKGFKGTETDLDRFTDGAFLSRSDRGDSDDSEGSGDHDQEGNPGYGWSKDDIVLVTGGTEETDDSCLETRTTQSIGQDQITIYRAVSGNDQMTAVSQSLER